MRTTLIASLFALIGLAAAAPSQAMPFAPADEAGGVTLVAYGCGAGFTRGPHGHCHPIGRPVYAHPYAHPYARHCWWRNGVRVCR